MSTSRRTLVLIRRGDREVTRIAFSRRRLALLGAGLASALAAVALVGSFAAASRAGRTELDRLRAENEALRSSGSAFELRLREVQTRLTETEDRTRKLAIVAGLGNVGGGSEAGIGGELHDSAPAATALALIEDRAGRVERQLEAVGTRIDENLRRLSATPSIWPVAGILTSGFGTRRDPITGVRALHSGVDISAPPGRPVAAAASGIVVKTEQFGGLGRAIYIAHGFGRTTVYGHLSRVLVVPGQKVERGATIGLVGNTGRSTGYHLHYEVQVDGDSVNPLPFLLREPRAGS